MRRLGEEIYGSRSTIQHKTSSSDVGSVCDQSLDGQFFRSTDIHVRFLSTLIILRTINQGMHLCLSVFFSVNVSVSILTAIFPGVPGLARTRMSPFWILLKLRMMEVVVTTGAMRRAKLQSNRHHQQTKVYIYNSFSEFVQIIHWALSFFVGYPCQSSVVNFSDLLYTWYNCSL